MRFYYVYKALAHPEMDRYLTPFTLEERLMHVAEAERRLGTRIPWLADGMDNRLKQALGNMNNAEVITDARGRVVQRRDWSDPHALREDLAALVGRIEDPTSTDEIELKTAPPIDTVATGVVPRLELDGSMVPVKVEPDLSRTEHPFYAKLWAEADGKLLAGQAGRLYLGFHLDPLYRVHWNNLVRPLEFVLTPPEGITIDPVRGQAPRPAAAVDADPREFLVSVERPAAGSTQQAGPLQLSVRYFACDDANTFCVPVLQHYRLELERDPLAGTVRERARGDRPDRVQQVMGRDANGDGKISREEAPQSWRERFDEIDTNGDGYIDVDELRALLQRLRAAERMERRRGRPVAPPE